VFDCDAGADDSHGVILAFYNAMKIEKEKK